MQAAGRVLRARQFARSRSRGVVVPTSEKGEAEWIVKFFFETSFDSLLLLPLLLLLCSSRIGAGRKIAGQDIEPEREEEEEEKFTVT